MKAFLLVFLMGFSLIGFGQKHDYVWLFGYSSLNNPEDSLWGTSIIDFKETPPRVFYDGYKEMDFDGNHTNISDENGNFMFSSNGSWIENHQNLSMENDDFEDNMFDPTVISQGTLVLPLNNNQYAFFHSTTDFSPDISITGKDIFFSKIDMGSNGGLGRVFESNKLILSDTLDHGKLTATKHANGKDWWLLVRKNDGNQYFKILFKGDSFEISTQIVGQQTFKGLGQACFSPDGSKYALASSIRADIGRYFDLYDFDRCTGELNNHIQVHAERSGVSGGIVFSPNSRFLYVGGYDKIFQYDTWAADVAGSEEIVAEYDGYQDSIRIDSSITLSATRFLNMQLAPDNKIYVNTPGSTRYLHVIQFPNEKGMACGVKQHALKLQTLNTSIPNFPNYRLGALENSPCDTLSTTTAESITPNPKINLYPNPTSGELTIDFEKPTDGEGQFIVFDLTGKQVNKFPLATGQSEFQFELNDLARGMYFYKIETEGIPIKTGKLVIEK